ncbi:hypothetical protein [Helicobacter heilmannii]|uniref:Inactive homolog of metal-dependent proteases, putative molecular chaperone n=1 Tax=Helicobacter heilmannii TaxID=35817 RepID=A0A0K2XVU3_HELHE|nr:hypothetical protein [Helicobacter heilmannii]CCM10941.1 Inactive homolog of metal-dependent proteases,putative molecular chaperone [Helicobacter heilmannii ASB1.4]CRF48342.1 TsaB protein, required for threonylcarbamoyladenosine (t(6)A) formation in tRNA [Helicobacter heilmannii]CRF48940.1 TsaB protein, required for threonylcarbamoyladenosine (t(6)A) formation in tRNA [Helicobacter heilmannii]CRF51272.1 TsaB protein, required for threonylcarbamoyladenosine (t(6)A) formation in tRNA [Helicoba
MQEPTQVGVYALDGRFLHAFNSNERTNTALIQIFEAMLKWLEMRRLSIQALCYVRGPGSFMAMKLTHIFVHAWVLLNPTPLRSALGFAFNENSPIKAFGKSFYVYEGDQVVLKTFESPPPCQEMRLPPTLDPLLFSTTNEPLYFLPPV